MADGSGGFDRNEARLRRIVEGLSAADRIAIASMLREASATDIAGRVPPHNSDAEAAVLSAILTSHGKVIPDVLEHLPDGTSFYADAHSRIFDVCLEIHREGQPTDVQTVASRLKDRGRLIAIGGITYLVQIADATPSVANVAAHAQIVRDKARVRRVIETCQMIAAVGYTDHGTADEYIADALDKVNGSAERSSTVRIESLEEIGRQRDDEIREQWEGKRDPWGMRGPHERLHLLMHGYGLGEQTYIAADTGGGKSAFALQVDLHVAGREFAGEKTGCGYISLEMQSKKHYDRAVVMAARKMAQKLRVRPIVMKEYLTGFLVDLDGRLTKERISNDQVAVIEEARRLVRAKPIEFTDADHDVVKLRATLHAMQRRLAEKGATLRMVTIDHMHVMTFPDENTEAEALATMVKGFNDIAKSMNLHLKVLAQFGTKTQQRDVPTRDDIRGASAIQQIAHKILLLHRPFTRMSLKQKEAATVEEKREASAILAKHRDGQEGAEPMVFTGEAFRFDEV
jgi:replicative DNA helicase